MKHSTTLLPLLMAIAGFFTLVFEPAALDHATSVSRVETRLVAAPSPGLEPRHQP